MRDPRGDGGAGAAGLAPAPIPLLGLRFAPVSRAEVVDVLERLIRAGGPRVVVTANVQHVGLCARDPACRAAFARADLVTADGMPICWVARWVGRPLPGRVTGSDLVEPLARRCAERGHRLFLLGGEPGVADEVARTLVARAPGLRVVGTHCPPHVPLDAFLDSAASEEAIARVRAAAPDVLLVALGTPKQELWIDRHRERLGVPLTIGVGAAFDFLVGRQQRAPRWMRAVGAEWLHRAATSPRRLLPRYAREGATFARLTWRELRGRGVVGSLPGEGA